MNIFFNARKNFTAQFYWEFLVKNVIYYVSVQIRRYTIFSPLVGIYHRNLANAP